MRNVRMYASVCSFSLRVAAFSHYQIVHGLPPPPFSHPDPLECWYLRVESALHISAWGDETWGISGRYSVAIDTSVWGLRKSRHANQPVNLWIVNLNWHGEWFWAVVYLW